MGRLFKCKDCGNDVSLDAKACPKCGAKVRRPITILEGVIAVGAAISVAILIGAAMNRGGSEPSTTSEISADPKPAGLQLLDGWKVNRGEYGAPEIVGTVRNNSGREYGYVQISFNLYDKDGAVIGTAWTNVTNLDAGGSWKFKAGCMERYFASCRFKDLAGY